MHHHCEIVLPPGTDNIEAAVASVMRHVDENMSSDNEEFSDKHAFWDFYVIGGRFAGSKLMARYDQDRVSEFHKWLTKENVTVSGFVCGKQELKPASQIEKVDSKWNEMFPSEGNVMVACPIFAHSNDQYGRDGRGTIDGDVCTLGEAMDVSCERVIFAGPSYDLKPGERTGPPEAVFMLCGSQWNGVNHMPVAWDGKIGSALSAWSKGLANYKETYQAIMRPHAEWITVTVDYHS